MTPRLLANATRRSALRSRGSSRRRGASLVVFMISIPAALAVFLLILDRVDTAASETRRAERRTQTRLLAESAIARMQADGRGAQPIKGAIEGAGSYEAVIESRDADAAKIVFLGALDRVVVYGQPFRIVCEIKGEMNTKSGDLALGDPSWRAEPLGPSPKPGRIVNMAIPTPTPKPQGRSGSPFVHPEFSVPGPPAR